MTFDYLAVSGFCEMKFLGHILLQDNEPVSGFCELKFLGYILLQDKEPVTNTNSTGLLF